MLPADFDLKVLSKRLWREMSDDHVGHGAAALAFYWALALFPGAMFAIGALRYVNAPRLQRAVLDLIHQALPHTAADVFSRSVKAAESQPGVGLWVLGLAFALWSASSGFTGIMRQLNIIYEVEEARSLARLRLTALLLTLSCSGLLLAALALAVGGGKLQDFIGARFGFSDALLTTFAALRWVVIALALTLAFSLIYHWAPNVKRSFSFGTPGSVLATAGLILTSLFVKGYVAHSGKYGVLYGQLGGVMILLLWLFLAGWVTLVGGELNDAMARCFGKGAREAAEKPKASRAVVEN